MKNQWPIWLLIVGVIIVILFVFNYQGGDQVPLNEIFPETSQENKPAAEYEFVTSPEEGAKTPTVQSTAVITPPPQGVSSAPSPQPKPQPAVTTSAPEGSQKSFAVQVASSKDKDRADMLAKKLTQEGYQAFVKTRDLGDKGIWYRICVGKYETKQQAESVLPKLQEKYQDSFIIVEK